MFASRPNATLGRRAGQRQAPTFQPRQVFTHGIHRMNVGARRQQQTRHRLLVGQRHLGTRRWQQGRSATRETTDHEIFCGQSVHCVLDRPHAALASCIRHRVSGFMQCDALQHRSVPVLHDHAATRDLIAKKSFNRLRHRRRGLTRTNHHHPANPTLWQALTPRAAVQPIAFSSQHCAHGGSWLNRCNRCLETPL